MEDLQEQRAIYDVGRSESGIWMHPEDTKTGEKGYSSSPFSFGISDRISVAFLPRDEKDEKDEKRRFFKEQLSTPRKHASSKKKAYPKLGKSEINMGERHTLRHEAHRIRKSIRKY